MKLLKPPTLLVALALAVFGIGCGQKPASTQSNAPAPAKDTGPATKDQAVAVTDVQLVTDYSGDKDAADKKYKDKVLEIDGIVFALHPGELVLKGTSNDTGLEGKQVVCKIAPASQEKADGLTPSQKVKVKGKFADGRQIALLLVDGQVTEVGPDPSMAVTAVDLTKEYAKDAAAADKKYKDKQLLVEGTVVDVKERDSASGPQPIVVLEGFDEKAKTPLRVKVIFPSADKDKAKTAKGQKVKVKGKCAGMMDGAVAIWYPRLAK